MEEMVKMFISLTSFSINTHFISLVNGDDPDQAAPVGAAWSGSTLFNYKNINVNVGVYFMLLPIHFIYLAQKIFLPTYIFSVGGVSNKYSWRNGLSNNCRKSVK